MYCKKCGTELENGAKFCNVCGTDQTEEFKQSNKKNNKTYLLLVLLAYVGGLFIPLIGYGLAGAGIGLSIKALKRKDKLAILGIVLGIGAIAFSVWSGIVGSRMINDALGK